MPSAAHRLRLQIEAALAHRIPGALTPAPRAVRPTAPTGLAALDERLGGGLPLGAISELAGPECSGRTSLALSLIARLTQAARVCAWVDVSDTLDPESAAAAGVDLARLLWVRCGPEPQQLVLPGFSAAQRSLTVRNDPAVQQSLTVREDFTPRCAEPVPKVRRAGRETVPLQPVPCPAASSELSARYTARPSVAAQRPLAIREYSRLDQALRAVDLLLNAGGFSAIVLDMGSVAPEYALRVPLATWFRYRSVAERTQAIVLLLTQQPCTRSSAELVLECESGQVFSEGSTVLTGAEYQVEIARERFARSSQVTDLSRKPPQSDHSAGSPLRWQSQTPWSAPHSAQPAKAGRP